MSFWGVFVVLLISFTFLCLVASDTVELCACPDSPCPGSCRVYETEQCQPFYQCFSEANGLFGHVYPTLSSDGREVVVKVYGNSTCPSGAEVFDSAENGWAGFCNTACWSLKSNIGAGQCTVDHPSSAPTNRRVLVVPTTLYHFTLLGSLVAATLWNSML
eukprot:scaffold7294_cov93-Cylindrotheca_fusiformis.AAC.7